MKFEEMYQQMCDKLKSQLTADNTEMIQELKQGLDNLKSAHESVVEENSKLKDKIVDQVKFTSFKEDLREDPAGQPLTVDEALAQALKNLK